MLMHIYDFANKIFNEKDVQGMIDEAARKHQEYVGHYLDDWKWILNGIIAPSKLGKYHVWCIICSCDGNVLVSGVNVIQMHIVDLSRQCLNAKFIFMCTLTRCVGFCCRFYKKNSHDLTDICCSGRHILTFERVPWMYFNHDLNKVPVVNPQQSYLSLPFQLEPR